MEILDVTEKELFDYVTWGYEGGPDGGGGIGFTVTREGIHKYLNNKQA
jgi:hypothetical protein